MQDKALGVYLSTCDASSFAFSIINSLDTQKLGFFAVQSITKLINRKEMKGNRSDYVIIKCEVLIKVGIKDPFHKMRAETKERVIISFIFQKEIPLISCAIVYQRRYNHDTSPKMVTCCVLAQ